MSNPRFKVGEQVILQSKHHQELNGGPYVVTEYRYGIFHNKDTLQTGYINGYKISVSDSWWNQNALRKYYPPSDITFKEMMDGLTKEIV